MHASRAFAPCWTASEPLGDAGETSPARMQGKKQHKCDLQTCLSFIPMYLEDQPRLRFQVSWAHGLLLVVLGPQTLSQSRGGSAQEALVQLEHHKHCQDAGCAAQV